MLRNRKTRDVLEKQIPIREVVGGELCAEEISDFATSFNISDIYMFGLVGRHGYALQLK